VYSMLVHLVSQELYPLYTERTHLQASIQLVVVYSIENLLNMFQVLLLCFAEDKDIVQVDDHKGIRKGLQDVIHHLHECNKDVSHVESYN
jgi:hypothetical protein